MIILLSILTAVVVFLLLMFIVDETNKDVLFSNLMALRQAGLISADTLLKNNKLNPEFEARKMTDERDTIFDANKIQARQIAMTQGLQMKMQMDMQEEMRKPKNDGV